MAEKIIMGGEDPADAVARKAAWDARDVDAEMVSSSLNMEDVERLLLAEVPGMTSAKITQSKRDRGKAMP